MFLSKGPNSSDGNPLAAATSSRVAACFHVANMATGNNVTTFSVLSEGHLEELR